MFTTRENSPRDPSACDPFDLSDFTRLIGSVPFDSFTTAWTRASEQTQHTIPALASMDEKVLSKLGISLLPWRMTMI